MQTKTRYYIAIIILVVAAILLNIYAGRKKRQVESILSQGTPAEGISTLAQPPENGDAAPVTYIKHGAITIIKTEKPAASRPKSKAGNVLPGNSSISQPAGSSQLDIGTGEGFFDRSSSGITKEHKYPTPEEKAEMNAKGIVLF